MILGLVVKVFIAYSEVSHRNILCEGTIAKSVTEVCQALFPSQVRTNNRDDEFRNASRGCYSSQIVTTIIQMLVTVELAGKFGHQERVRI